MVQAWQAGAQAQRSRQQRTHPSDHVRFVPAVGQRAWHCRWVGQAGGEEGELRWTVACRPPVQAGPYGMLPTCPAAGQTRNGREAEAPPVKLFVPISRRWARGNKPGSSGSGPLQGWAHGIGQTLAVQGFPAGACVDRHTAGRRAADGLPLPEQPRVHLT